MSQYPPIAGADHDCGYMECGPTDCQVVRDRMSEAALIEANVNRDGTLRGLPECGFPGFYGGGCTLTEGHRSRYHRRGGGVIYGGESPSDTSPTRAGLT
jgi:hypothetical protein